MFLLSSEGSSRQTSGMKQSSFDAVRYHVQYKPLIGHVGSNNEIHVTLLVECRDVLFPVGRFEGVGMMRGKREKRERGLQKDDLREQ